MRTKCHRNRIEYSLTRPTANPTLHHQCTHIFTQILCGIESANNIAQHANYPSCISMDAEYERRLPYGTMERFLKT